MDAIKLFTCFTEVLEMQSRASLNIQISMHRVCVVVALTNLVKSSSSDKVREKATGALWILENRDQAKNRRGLYMLYV